MLCNGFAEVHLRHSWHARIGRQQDWTRWAVPSMHVNGCMLPGTAKSNTCKTGSSRTITDLAGPGGHQKHAALSQWRSVLLHQWAQCLQQYEPGCVQLADAYKDWAAVQQRPVYAQIQAILRHRAAGSQILWSHVTQQRPWQPSAGRRPKICSYSRVKAVVTSHQHWTAYS